MKGNAVSLGILNVSTGSGQSKQFIGYHCDRSLAEKTQN